MGATQFVRALSDEDAARFLYDWDRWVQPHQETPAGDWRIWLFLAGRASGKTRTGAEWVRRKIERGEVRRVGLISPTAASAREVMVEGESGLLACCPPWNRPLYEPSRRQLTWPNGAIATTYSADEPERLRGPQHDLIWADELAAWRYPEAWDMAILGLRLGSDPRAIVTTTPKPVGLIRSLVAREGEDVVVTRASTFDNALHLPHQSIEQFRSQYEGTRLGLQELHAHLLEEAEGALWSRKVVAAAFTKERPPLQRIVVAIDPAVTSNEQSDETGIIVAGLGEDGLGYVLADLSGRYSPDGWARRAVEAYEHWRADRIIGEVNNGGELIERTLRTLRGVADVDHGLPYKAIRASKGKAARAEPVAALYEQGRVKHVVPRGHQGFAELEEQLCTWEPLSASRSPDRLDALVWALSELIVDRRARVMQGKLM